MTYTVEDIGKSVQKFATLSKMFLEVRYIFYHILLTDSNFDTQLYPPEFVISVVFSFASR